MSYQSSIQLETMNGNILPLHRTASPQELAQQDEPAEQVPGPEMRSDTGWVTVDGGKQPYEGLIQPHSDAGGDAYYIGDAYESIRGEDPIDGMPGWRLRDLDKRPYLNYVRKAAGKLPHLEYLAHWMQVSAAPPKWKFLCKFPEHISERARRTHVSVIDFDRDHRFSREDTYHSCDKLKTELDKWPEQCKTSQTRLIVVEDLSRDVVELLGSTYDIDPLFFLSHISDYLFHNTRDRWVELPDLDVVARQRRHFHLQYLRPRYFETPKAFDDAELESGLFNVLRRLDSDRSRMRLQNMLLDRAGASVALTRAKTSYWFKPRVDGEPVLGILLVDPTVKSGHALWGGYRPFENTPSMNDIDDPAASASKRSLFDDVVHWSKKLSREDVFRAQTDERCLANPMYRIVLSEWRTVLKYMMTTLGKIEWEFENPHWGERPSDVDNSLRKLSPWRRNFPYYQAMVHDSIDRLFHPGDRLFSPSVHAGLDATQMATPAPKGGVFSLLYDFRLVQQELDACQVRIERAQNVATNSINIEENRRAVKQNNNLARLTFLATIFIPLSFTTSFLSMSPGFVSGKSIETIWLFFALGIPLTVFALLVVDLSSPNEPFVKRKWRTLRETRKKSRSIKTESQQRSRPRPYSTAPLERAVPLTRGSTIDWPTHKLAPPEENQKRAV